MPICDPSSSSSSGKSWIIHSVALAVAAAVALGAHAYIYYRRPGKFRSRVVGIIPARFASSRFHILGKPMIQPITSESCQNGTERCNEALKKLGKQYDAVVNIQGDEPFIDPEMIEAGIVKALQVIKVDHESHGVDVPEDIDKIENFMRERNLH